jgi:regulator of sigma E protease
VKDFEDFVAQITPHPGGTISLTFQRNGLTHTVQVEVASVQADGKYVGRIEAEGELPTDVPYPPSMVRHVTVSPVAAVGRAAEEAWGMTALQGRLFWRMMLGQVSLKNLSGPVSIAQYAGESASEGAGAFLDFLVMISLSLGFLNLLPIPILDGGQIVFQLVEWVKGSPMSERAQAFGQQVGIALLILLMGVALFNDIARQFS